MVLAKNILEGIYLIEMVWELVNLNGSEKTQPELMDFLIISSSLMIAFSDGSNPKTQTNYSERSD